nr:calcium:calmodulin dependent 3'5' cyclic [Hymenolepis microstoma]
MGACYSECEESITPDHLGNAVRNYQQQHQIDQQFEPQQQQQIRQTIQDILSHPVTSDEVQQEAFEDGDDFFDMRLKQKSQELSPGFPPSRVERLSLSSIDENEGAMKCGPNYEKEFPSLSNSSVAIYAKRRLSIEGLPTPGSTDSTFACVLRLRKIVKLTEQNKITKSVLIENLTYALQVVEKTYIEETKRLKDEDDELSDTACSEVPDEVRDWLASTFTRNQSSAGRRMVKPRFRSVVNAIRAGIVVERIYRRMSSCTCLTLPPNVVLLLKGGLDEWNFDIFEFNEVSQNHALKYVGFELLHKYDLITKFQIDGAKLENLLLRLEIGYSKYKNPYHNLIHAADVAQTCHVVLTTSKLRDYLSDLDIFSVIFAALAHDFEHTGTTNNFHIQTQTELAMLYNDRNVLENFHVSAVFRITQEAEFNIFEKMSREQYQEFRTAVIDMVLNTDMSLHFSQVKTMKNLIGIPEIIDKLKALSLLVHCADIAHPTKQWNLHKEWSVVLCEEFFRQGDREKELGMPISPLCDRNTVVLPQSQIGFIDYIVEPIFVVLGDMLDKMMENATSSKEETDVPDDDAKELESIDDSEGVLIPVLRPWALHLKENRMNWGKELEQLEKESGKEKEHESADNSKISESTNAQGKVTESTKSTLESEGGDKESVRIEIDDRLTDDNESIDFIDRDGEDEKEVTG